MISGVVGVPGLIVVLHVGIQEAQERGLESVFLVQVDHHLLYHVLESLKKNQFDQFPERGRTFEVLRSLHLLDSSFNILVPN